LPSGRDVGVSATVNRAEYTEMHQVQTLTAAVATITAGTTEDMEATVAMAVVTSLLPLIGGLRCAGCQGQSKYCRAGGA